MTAARHLLGGIVALAVVASGCRSAAPRSSQADPPRRLDAVEGLQGDTGVVRTDFRAELEPDQERNALLDLARAYEAQGNPEAAVAAYQRALEVPGAGRARGKAASARQALTHRRMAAALDRLGRFAQAETHYREALRLSPDDPKVWNDSGYSQYLQGRWADAERSLRTAAKLAPEDARIQTNLGLCLAAAGKTDEALEALTKAGGPAVGRANLAYILAAAGKDDAARERYQAALRLQPDLEPARAALARLDRPRDGPVAAAPETQDRRVGRASAPTSGR